MALHGNLPTFSTLQTLSATAHLNALQAFISSVHDDIVGSETPSMGVENAYIRHKWETLAYKVDCGIDVAVTISVNGVVVATIGPGVVSGTVDITAQGLIVDEFYPVVVAGTNLRTVYYVREQRSQFMPLLAAFTNGTTPTAAQWQVLATYAGLLSDDLDHPVPVATRQGALSEPDVARGMLIHRGRWLRYGFWLRAGYHRENGATGDRHCRVRLYINNVLVAKFNVGDVDTADGTEFFRHMPLNAEGDPYDSSAGYEHTFDSVDDNAPIDLDIYCPGLVLGTAYEWRVEVEDAAYAYDLFGPMAEIQWLYEYAEEDTDVAGWVRFLDWPHGQPVWGDVNLYDGSARKMTTVTGNLAALAAAITAHNYPAPQRAVFDVPNPKRSYLFLWAVRRRRWLWYRTMTDEDCTVHWNYRGETKTTTLPDTKGDFLAADLDALDGLFVGVEYWLGGAEYAIEDA